MRVRFLDIRRGQYAARWSKIAAALESRPKGQMMKRRLPMTLSVLPQNMAGMDISELRRCCGWRAGGLITNGLSASGGKKL